MRKFLRLCIVSLLAIPAIAIAADDAKHADHEMHLPKKAICVLMPTKGNKAEGILTLSAGEGFVQITGTVKGLTPGKHGFHIHEFGDTSAADGASAGGHFNPDGHEHGGPEGEKRHAGDLGNIVTKADGTADVQIKAEGLKLHFVIGRSLVIHAKEDDFKTQPSGDSGPRVLVGVIGIANDKPAAPAATKGTK